MPEYYVPASFFCTMKIPIQTKANAMISFVLKGWLLSDNKKADSNAPKIGLVKPKTVILETGLYFKSRAHKVYAIADTRAR